MNCRGIRSNKLGKAPGWKSMIEMRLQSQAVKQLRQIMKRVMMQGKAYDYWRIGMMTPI